MTRRIPHQSPLLLSAASVALLAACSGGAPTAPDGAAAAAPTDAAIRDDAPLPDHAFESDPAAATRSPGAQAAMFEDAALGLRIAHVPGMHLVKGAAASSLGADGWKAYGESGGNGTVVVQLAMDGSNDVTAAQLRIGRSADPQAVARCDTTPDASTGRAVGARVGGQGFIHFMASDGATSHYRQVDGYRAMRDGQCVAIDLIVSGVRPEVFNPPKQPPFTADEAQAQLQQALSAIEWTR